MIKFFFLLPLITCGIWWAFLNMKGYKATDGLKGFAYILTFNALIIVFFLVMIYVTK